MGRLALAVSLAFCCMWTVTGSLASAAEPNTLSELERKSGWRLLFDGKTTDGWRNYQSETVGDGWQIVDGALTCTGRRAGDLITIEQFGSFDLQLEYQISSRGNSGVMYHVTEQYDVPWKSGPEVQILDDGVHADPQLSGWLYGLYRSRRDVTRPAGQWNELHIRVTPTQCVTYMNCIPYCRYVKGDEDWKRRVANSKFAQFPGFGTASRGHICLQDHGDEVAFRNIKIRTYDDHPAPYNPIDGTLPVSAELAFPKLQWTGWSAIDDKGRVGQLRPVLLTHAGDASNRIFVATQLGVIHVFDNREEVDHTKIFLDIRRKTSFQEREFERGLMGLAFHPRFRENGQFFVYYTTPGSPMDSVISRFRVSREDPNRADPASEEVILRFRQPYWNHNGGTLVFGPDGKLYIAVGDGGAANDPHENGQNLRNIFGTVLRIDVDQQDPGRLYAIPRDNPFTNRRDARGEIWAYGLRNVWRMAFDRQSGLLWAADVGQDLYEEIDILRPGGNYGWSLREGMHTFGRRGTGPRDELIEPVWEYDHTVGVSITGGSVYRGQRVPELKGHYLYADFISGLMWALRYDHQQQKVIGNYTIPLPSIPVTSFGEDEEGEFYFTAVTATGEGIYRFKPTN